MDLRSNQREACSLLLKASTQVASKTFHQVALELLLRKREECSRGMADTGHNHKFCLQCPAIAVGFGTKAMRSLTNMALGWVYLKCPIPTAMGRKIPQAVSKWVSLIFLTYMGSLAGVGFCDQSFPGTFSL